MSNATAYPLQWPTGWPRTSRPVRSKFGRNGNTPSVDSSSLFLMEEVQRLNGQSIRERSVNNFVLSTNIRLRGDGLPYSNQSGVKDTGAAVYFKYKGEDMAIACDTFDRVGCNIYAIAKTIEAMRGIERWGCSELMNRAFTGFLALPEKAGGTAWYTYMQLSEEATVDEIKSRYRELAKKLHPDMPGGSGEQFHVLEEAYKQAKTAKNFQ